MTAPQTELIDETGRVVFRGTQSPGGGSVPGALRILDGGTFAVADLLAGPVVVYTPGASEEVWALLIADLLAFDAGGGSVTGIGVGDANPATLPNSLPALSVTGGSTFDSIGGAGQGFTADGLNRITPLTGPVSAFLYYNQNVVQGPWQAATTYHNDDFTSVIVAAGHVWFNTGATGVSGSSEPDFAGNIGGSVADGSDIVWQDNGVVPAAGSVTLRIAVATPVAP